jgi:ATP-dependent Clp protease adaptor protein ClpS
MTVAVPEVVAEPVIRHAPRWNVVLLNDDDHSYEYVIVMLMELFGHDQQRAWRHACEVDATGRTIVDTTSKERGELKVEQIHAYGPDPLIPRCAGSMAAVLEPAN